MATPIKVIVRYGNKIIFPCFTCKGTGDWLRAEPGIALLKMGYDNRLMTSHCQTWQLVWHAGIYVSKKGEQLHCYANTPIIYNVKYTNAPTKHILQHNSIFIAPGKTSNLRSFKPYVIWIFVKRQLTLAGSWNWTNSLKIHKANTLARNW